MYKNLGPQNTSSASAEQTKTPNLREAGTDINTEIIDAEVVSVATVDISTETSIAKTERSFRNLLASETLCPQEFASHVIALLNLPEDDNLKFEWLIFELSIIQPNVRFFDLMHDVSNDLHARLKEITRINWQSFFSRCKDHLRSHQPNNSALFLALLIDRLLLLKRQRGLIPEELSLHRELILLHYDVIINYCKDRLDVVMRHPSAKQMVAIVGVGLKSENAYLKEELVAINVLIMHLVVDTLIESSPNAAEKDKYITPAHTIYIRGIQIFIHHFQTRFLPVAETVLPKAISEISESKVYGTKAFIDFFATQRHVNIDLIFFKKFILPLIIDRVYVVLFEGYVFTTGVKNEAAQNLLAALFPEKDDIDYKILMDVHAAQASPDKRFNHAHSLIHESIQLLCKLNICTATLSQMNFAKKKEFSPQIKEIFLNKAKFKEILRQFLRLFKMRSDDDVWLGLLARLYFSFVLSLGRILLPIKQKITEAELQVDDIATNKDQTKALQTLKASYQIPLLHELMTLLHRDIFPAMIESHQDIARAIKLRHLLSFAQTEYCLTIFDALFAEICEHVDHYYSLNQQLDRMEIEYERKRNKELDVKLKASEKKAKESSDKNAQSEKELKAKTEEFEAAIKKLTDEFTELTSRNSGLEKARVQAMQDKSALEDKDKKALAAKEAVIDRLKKETADKGNEVQRLSELGKSLSETLKIAEQARDAAKAALEKATQESPSKDKRIAELTAQIAELETQLIKKETKQEDDGLLGQLEKAKTRIRELEEKGKKVLGQLTAENQVLRESLLAYQAMLMPVMPPHAYVYHGQPGPQYFQPSSDSAPQLYQRASRHAEHQAPQPSGSSDDKSDAATPQV